MESIKGMLFSGTQRSRKAQISIVMSFIAKGISFGVSLLVVPLTIKYISSSQYGVWLTLSSIISWVAIMDFGLGNGFRNRFAEAMASNDKKLADSYLSTAYFAISCVVCLLLPSMLLANHFLDWAGILNVDLSMTDELRNVFVVLSIFFCLNMVANVYPVLLSADQRQGVASMVTAGGQIASLVVIWVLTRVSEGSMYRLALYFSGVPCLFMTVVSVVDFLFGHYRDFRPSLIKVKIKLVKNILNLGIVFFLTNLCVLLVFQLTNIVLSRELGPDIVTQYNVAFKYFNIIYVIALIVVTPYWSAYTDAYSKHDTAWMTMTLRRLEKAAAAILVIGVLLLFLSPYFYKVWVGEEVAVPFELSVAMLLYFSFLIFSTVYTYLIAGTGKIRIQFIIYLVMSVVSYPLLVCFSRHLGVIGIVIPPIVTSLFESVFCRIQLGKIIRGTANGWWGK